MANDHAVSLVLARLVTRLQRLAPRVSVEVLPLEKNFTERLAGAEQAAGQCALRLFAPPVPVGGFDVAMAWPTQRHGDPAVEWLKGEVCDLFVQGP